MKIYRFDDIVPKIFGHLNLYDSYTTSDRIKLDDGVYIDLGDFISHEDISYIEVACENFQTGDEIRTFLMEWLGDNISKNISYIPERWDYKMYGVRLIRESLEIKVLGLGQDVNLSWDKNMIGALPVFKDRDSALKYANGREELIFSLSK